MGNSGRRYWWIAAAVIAGALLAPAGAEAAGGQVLLSDSFNGPTTTAPLVSLNSLTPGFPCLTAGTSTTATPVAGCNLASPDPNGSGVLRLTDANESEASGMVYDTSFPTSAGLDITFDQYQYGGSGADGISFDLAVAPPQPAAIGPSGGALGYATNIGAPNPDGLPGGYLGIGLDAYGNFTNTFFDGAGCTDPSWAGATQFPNEVTVRGPGNGGTGYCLLSSSLQDTPDPLGASGPIQLSTSAATRPAPEAVQILINPANGGSYTVGIDPTGGSDFQTVTSGPLPSSYYDPTNGAVVGGLPSRLTFALAASTGAFTDVHEISNVNATTLNGSVPILSLTSTDSGDGFANANNSLIYSLVAGVSASSPASETNPTSMVVTDTVPSDESIVGTPSGDGWNCSSSSSTTASMHEHVFGTARAGRDVAADLRAGRARRGRDRFDHRQQRAVDFERRRGSGDGVRFGHGHRRAAQLGRADGFIQRHQRRIRGAVRTAHVGWLGRGWAGAVVLPRHRREDADVHWHDAGQRECVLRGPWCVAARYVDHRRRARDLGRGPALHCLERGTPADAPVADWVHIDGDRQEGSLEEQRHR